MTPKSDDPTVNAGCRDAKLVSPRFQIFHVATPKLTTITVEAGCGGRETSSFGAITIRK